MAENTRLIEAHEALLSAQTDVARGAAMADHLAAIATIVLACLTVFLVVDSFLAISSD